MLCGQSSGSCYHHLCSELDKYIADDWVTSTMRPHPCWSEPQFGEIIVNSRAFADDIEVIARTPRGAQLLLSSGSAAWKSVWSWMVCLLRCIDGKRKTWIVNPHSHLRVFRQPVPAIDIIVIQRNLGVLLSPMRMGADIVDRLSGGLGNITSVPLKLQQHLFILNNNLIPAMYHQLVLVMTSKKYLQSVGLSVGLSEQMLDPG